MTSSKPQNPWRTVPDPPPSTKSRFLEDFARWNLDVREIYFTYPSRPGVGSSLIHPVHKYRTYLHEMAGAARCSQHRASCVQCAKGTVCVFDVGSGEITSVKPKGRHRPKARERNNVSPHSQILPVCQHCSSPVTCHAWQATLNCLCFGEPAHEMDSWLSSGSRPISKPSELDPC